MARVTAAQWLDKWGRRLQAAGPDIAAGIDRVQVAPGQSAAAAVDRYTAGLMDSIQQGTWETNVAKVSLADWKNATKTKGAARISSGVTQAQSTKQAKITQTLQAVDQSVAEIANMPSNSLEARIARSVAFQRAMSKNAPKRNQ
jgi:hypothetical protein